jgi:hypothetical protein
MQVDAASAANGTEEPVASASADEIVTTAA